MLDFSAKPVPLQVDPYGVVRVGQTRVTLHTLLTAFNLGDTPEHIVASFPVLSLADVYAVVGYYLAHKAEVDAYLAELDTKQAALHAVLDATPGMAALRKRQTAFRAAQLSRV